MHDGQHDAAERSVEHAAGRSAEHEVPPPPPRAPSRVRQFAAVLRKNYLLQTRSRRAWWGGAGWFALLVEVILIRACCIEPRFSKLFLILKQTCGTVRPCAL